MIGNSVAQKKYGMRTLFPWKKKKGSVINNFQGMSSGHWVNINTWLMDICWFKLKQKLLRGKKQGSCFLRKKRTLMWFLSCPKPSQGFAALPFPTTRPHSHHTMSCGCPRQTRWFLHWFGAALEGWGCWWSPTAHVNPSPTSVASLRHLHWQGLLEILDPTSHLRQGWLQT